MNNILKLTILILIIITFQACSQKIQIKAIKAAKITNNSIRYISVEDFRHDNIAQSSQIQTALGNVQVDGKDYFHVVNRKDSNKILAEQKLKDSGLVDLIDDEPIKGLEDVKALLTGEVLLNDMSSSRYYETRTNYKRCIKSYKKRGKTYCKQYAKYRILCKSNIYSIKTKLNLIKISDGINIFSKMYSKSIKYSHCRDDRNILPSKRSVNTNLAKQIANSLILDIAPSYVYFTATLLDSLDVDLSSKQEDTFDMALKMIELKRISKANKLLQALNSQIHNNSYVILYDLAITTEALGDLNKALKLLNNAEDIAINKGKTIDEISNSIIRVKRNIAQQNKANKQL